MKKLYLLFPLLLFVFITCEDEPPEEELDTTPPTVTITSPQNNSTVSEIVIITCMSSDNEGVEKVELWVNGVSTGSTDETEPYSFDWNTTLVDNGNYNITVRSFDTSDNTTDSEPIVLTVDNTQSNPQPINITSVVFDNGGFTITWNQSTDGDFSSYELEKSVESTMDDYQMIYTTDELTNTSYVDSDIDPLSYQYYRITVIDTFSYETKGQIFSSSLDPVPNSVNITSVTYTMDEMTIQWEESSDGDFKSYKLLYSETESGDKDTVVTYTDKSTISHIITEFDPTQENWFWVIVSDTFNQTNNGLGYMIIDSPPTPSELFPIDYQDNFQIYWSKNNDNDFKSYKLYESQNEDMSNKSLITTFTESNDTTYTVNHLDNGEIRYYQIDTEDIWELTTSSNVSDYLIELWGQKYSLFNTTELNISWSLEGPIPSEIGLLLNLTRIDLRDNNLTGPIPSEIGNLTYLIELHLFDNQLSGPIPSEIGNLWYLQELLLEHNLLSGSIPSEIGDLTSLSKLWLQDNQFTGTIPEEICNLSLNWSNTNSFNINTNQLCPPYPSCIEDYMGEQDTSDCD